MPRQQEILPVFYYHDHFQEMIRLVVSLYGDMLGADERLFLDDFEKLSRPAQCLYIRMVNRKRAVFCSKDLIYPEIEGLPEALDELIAYGWARKIDAADYAFLLESLTKDRIHIGILNVGHSDIKASWKKDRLIDFMLQNVAFEHALLHCAADDFHRPERLETARFLLFLYFGKSQNNLTAFALRDLGLIDTKAKQEYAARFFDYAEARACYFFRSAIDCLKRKRDQDFDRYFSGLESLPKAESEYARDLRNDFLFLLGQNFERRKQADEAISVYRHADSFECRERLIRLLYNHDKEQAEHALSAMLASPSCDEEYIFALDFFERKFASKRTGLYTDLLRSGDGISVDECYRGDVEQAALLHYKSAGWIGAHAENNIWNALFGLLFWDELFEQPDSFCSGFDRVPKDLRSRNFYARHEQAIRHKVRLVANKQAFDLVKKIYNRRVGEQNGLFGWYDDLLDTLELMMENAPADGLAHMLEKMAKDFFGMCDGFPDLMLFRDGAMKLIEVKAEGDQIRRTQLVRFQQLKAAGFDVEILRVSYHVDPEQIYVVVDVETTGGRPPNDRVTEIGAVKIKNGTIIGEWSSLINPKRTIPSFITQLTGISNDMVADAPTFKDIAPDLALFMEGAVFAAHNVNFDYGFIASEFRRTGMHFKMPKICTCASMRRHYPGHSSYSLATLCREYGIKLAEHHRALCDAKAAAELLLLVNERRQGSKLLKAA